MTLSTTTDEFGQWLLVASPFVASPESFHKWNHLGGFHLVSSGTYRFTFFSSDFSLVGSYAWIRAVHRMPNSSNEIVSTARRIYPKPEKIRYEFWVPGNLAGIGVTEQRLEFKPLFRRYRTSSKVWSVQCEQLILTQKNTENTVTLSLDNPSYTKDPLRKDLWVSTFSQTVTDKRGLILPTFEVGRFYQISDNAPVSDPVILKSSNGTLTVAFTSPEIIQPDTLYVRIIY
jgi:hypothetical protein